MMAATADVSCRLAVSEISGNRPRKQSIPLGADAQLTVFVLAESPDKGLLFNDASRYVLDVIDFVVVYFT